MRKFLLIFIILITLGCQKESFNKSWTEEQAPERFLVAFETTKGYFELEVIRNHSPMAADRFYQLVKHEYFDNGLFYRVIKDYVAQFGNTDFAEMEKWRAVKIPDEPVKRSNKRGTISFAREGKESRDLEVFINLEDNVTLDTVSIDGIRGFPAFGTVVKGMSVVDKLYSKYGEKPMSDPDLYTGRARFLRSFPETDVIIKVTIMAPSE